MTAAWRQPHLCLIKTNETITSQNLTMKKSNTYLASHNLLGALLLLSVLSTVTNTPFEGFADLLAACKNQWQAFADSLSTMQPHRTVFPN